jgi:hypothetical protein
MDSKKKGPKVAIDINAQRRRREQQAIDIRKKRDEEQQAKRRGVSVTQLVACTLAQTIPRARPPLFRFCRWPARMMARQLRQRHMR